MFVRSRGVWFGFAEKMFMFCSAKSRKPVFFRGVLKTKTPKTPKIAHRMTLNSID